MLCSKVVILFTLWVTHWVKILSFYLYEQLFIVKIYELGKKISFNLEINAWQMALVATEKLGVHGVETDKA